MDVQTAINGQRLSEVWFLRDKQLVAQELLGKLLVSTVGDVVTAGRITEVELYAAPQDKASHAYNNRRTKRTEVLYSRPGRAYVHLTHQATMLNVVIGDQDIPHGVLIRALEPLYGLPSMANRRNRAAVTDLCSGPGKLCQALGIRRENYGINLITSTQLYILQDDLQLFKDTIVSSPRIGIDYAQEYRDIHWRFYVKDSPFLSRKA